MANIMGKLITIGLIIAAAYTLYVVVTPNHPYVG